MPRNIAQQLIKNNWHTKYIPM